MAFLESVQRIRERLLMEVLDTDPIEEPLPPKAEWPQWDRNSSSDVTLRVLSLNAWGISLGVVAVAMLRALSYGCCAIA